MFVLRRLQTEINSCIADFDFSSEHTALCTIERPNSKGESLLLTFILKLKLRLLGHNAPKFR